MTRLCTPFEILQHFPRFFALDYLSACISLGNKLDDSSSLFKSLWVIFIENLSQCSSLLGVSPITTAPDSILLILLSTCVYIPHCTVTYITLSKFPSKLQNRHCSFLFNSSILLGSWFIVHTLYVLMNPQKVWSGIFFKGLLYYQCQLLFSQKLIQETLIHPGNIY